MKFEQERKAILSAAMDMLQYSLVSLSGGNVAVRTEEGSVLITPSAMRYEHLQPEDIVLVYRVFLPCRTWRYPPCIGG